MRLSLGLVISILFHAALACVALFWVSGPAVHVNMDRPIYTVDLVSLAPPPAEVPVVNPVPQAVAETTAPVVEAQPEAPAVEVEAAPVVEAKPEPVVEAKPEPKPEPKEPEAKEISPKKVEKKQVAKKEEPKKVPEEKPKEAPKPKPKPQKTAKQLLAEGLAAAKAEAKKEEQRKAQALARELAALKKQEGAEVYAHGGQPGGAAGGVVGGTGSGLSEVYALIVGAAIKKHWRYPSFAGEANLVATVEINLAPDGKILSSQVLESSGNAEFDSSTLRAIKETEYVERPKVERDQVIRINFNSQELSE